jgi:hypothetical protein
MKESRVLIIEVKMVNNNYFIKPTYVNHKQVFSFLSTINTIYVDKNVENVNKSWKTGFC